MNSRITIFNGPPGSGKDEACSHLVSIFGFKHLSFKEQLIDDTIDYFSVNRKWFLDGYDIRAVKERPEELLRGLSRRQALIHVSENVMKPKFGASFYGDKVAAKIDCVSRYCVSDGGFNEEIMPIINTSGSDSILIIQLLRDGCSFIHDSRRYFNGVVSDEIIIGNQSHINDAHVYIDKVPVKTYRIHNNGSLKDFFQAIRNIHIKEGYA